MLSKENIAEYFKTLQDNICQAIEATDGKARFQEDNWQHHSGGGGRTRVITDGNIIEIDATCRAIGLANIKTDIPTQVNFDECGR